MNDKIVWVPIHHITCNISSWYNRMGGKKHSPYALFNEYYCTPEWRYFPVCEFQIFEVALFLCLNKNLLLTIGFKPHLSRIPNLCNSGLYIIKIIVWLHRVFNGCCFFLNCYITHILFSHGNWSVSVYFFSWTGNIYDYCWFVSSFLK